MGTHFLSQWKKLNRTKTILDKITASDIAYTILVYENTKEVWDEEIEIRENTTNDDERRKAISDSEMDGWILDGNTTENCLEFSEVLSRVQNGMCLRNTGNIIR